MEYRREPPRQHTLPFVQIKKKKEVPLIQPGQYIKTPGNNFSQLDARMSTSQGPIQVVTETGTGISMASSSTSFNGVSGKNWGEGGHGQVCAVVLCPCFDGSANEWNDGVVAGAIERTTTAAHCARESIVYNYIERLYWWRGSINKQSNVVGKRNGQ